MTADNLTRNAFGNDFRANSTSFDCGQRPSEYFENIFLKTIKTPADCQLSVSPPPELRVCFSKIRLLSWLKKDVGDHLDKLAKMERSFNPYLCLKFSKFHFSVEWTDWKNLSKKRSI